MIIRWSGLSVYLSCIVLLLLAYSGYVYATTEPHSESATSKVSSYSHQQALQLGERIYRKGILSNGDVMKAFVNGDVSVAGDVFSCVLCHRRSGLGSSEGNVIVLPINGLNLFRPRVLWDSRRRHSQMDLQSARSRVVPSYLLGKDLRSSYTDRSLEKVLRTGIDPAGRMLDKNMPRYDLNDIDMALLIYYLKNLTSINSPGVTAKVINFATIVTEGVNDIDRDAMLSVLQTHIKDRNAQTRNQLNRAKSGAFNKREADASYRILKLDVWELNGAEETWYQQLEKYHNKEDSVFAILGGITNGSWAPIHKFSESHNLPVIFPVTDKPVVSKDNWNTVYFSKGLYQEGETVANYIKRDMPVLDNVRIIQIYTKSSDGEILANGFNDAWKSFNLPDVDTYELAGNDLSIVKSVNDFIAAGKEVILLFWAGGKDILFTEALKQFKGDAIRVFVSSQLLHDDFSLISNELRDEVYITYPYSLPEEKKRNISLLKTWLKIKGIPVTNLRIQSKMYFLGWVLSDVMSGIKSEFYRDYFIERIEMMKDQTHAISVYPRLSLGPNQRYASKGCYIVQLTNEGNSTLSKKSNWVIQ